MVIIRIFNKKVSKYLIVVIQTSSDMTPAVKNGEKHLVDYVRQPDDKSLGTLGQVI